MALPDLEAFFAAPPAERSRRLREGVRECHRSHYRRNAAYRRTVRARGVGEEVGPHELTRLLRAASLTFKSYLETLGPFPQEDARGFVAWLGDHLSAPLPADVAPSLRRRYASMEGLLRAVERACSGMGLEIVTSSGTSGIASVVARDDATVDLAVHSFFTAIRRSWGVTRGSAMVFVMPEDTRVAMARAARIGTTRLDWAEGTSVHYTMPFSATPDRIRLRAGRTFHAGARGLLERRVLHPFMSWADGRWVAGRYVGATRDRVRELSAADRPLMLLGGLTQLHTIAAAGPLPLPAGSRVATGGGVKDDYPIPPERIRADLEETFPGSPVGDVYGMAEADWAAFECSHGNYHIPPWVYAVATDDADGLVDAPVATGLLAFFDPVAGGDLVPPFFQTADRVTLVNGGDRYDPALACPCGYDTAFVVGRIRRVDLMDEAGCAAQI